MIDKKETIPGYTPVAFTSCNACACSYACQKERKEGSLHKGCDWSTRADGESVMFIKNQEEKPSMSNETNWDKFSGNDSCDVISAYNHHKPEYPECIDIVEWLRADYKEPAYKLPEWFAVGKWIGTVYGCSKFVRITAIHPKRPGEDEAKFEVESPDGEKDWWWIAKVYVDEGKFTPAKIVPWTPEQAKAYIGRSLNPTEAFIDEATITCVRAKGKDDAWRVNMRDRYGHEFSRTLDELSRNYTLKSGQPCGTLVKA